MKTHFSCLESCENSTVRAVVGPDSGTINCNFNKVTNDDYYLFVLLTFLSCIFPLTKHGFLYENCRQFSQQLLAIFYFKNPVFTLHETN